MPYTGEEERKRKAQEQEQKPQGEEIPESEGDPKTKDDLLQKNKKALVVQVAGEEFIFTTSGQMWCWGLVDDVVTTDVPLALVYGHFKLNEEADKELQSGTAWKFAITDPKTRVQCSTEVAEMKEKCPEKLCELATILAALDEPKLECHDYDVDYQKNDEQVIVSREYNLKVTKRCSFSPAKCPGDFNEDWENAGSRLCAGAASKQWDWTTGKHKSGMLEVHDRLVYQDANQFQGINPTKPGIFAQKPVLVKKDTLRRWA